MRGDPLHGRALADRVLKGDRRAVARAITIVENGESGAREVLAGLGVGGVRSFILGITGPPGTGKSTLVDRLVERFRREGLKVGVIAVDPSSPITGGALLGDRIRMLRHSTDKGVFIRSMASRGGSGGLSAAVVDTIRIIDASGVDLIMVETVGIGQADIEVMGIVHAVMVVLMPSMGDDVQVSKAGLMEIGDVYVVNKSDLPGADAMAIDLLGMIKSSKRKPAVVKVSALKNEGVDGLAGEIASLRRRLGSPEGEGMRMRSLKGMLVEAAKHRMLAGAEKELRAASEELAERVAGGRVGFEEAVEEMVERRGRGPRGHPKR